MSPDVPDAPENFDVSKCCHLSGTVDSLRRQGATQCCNFVESGFSNPDFKTRKDPTKAGSHRPISLLPILSKIAEKIIQTRLNQHLSENDILISQQHAFRANLSASHQLLHAVEYIKTGFANKKSTGAVFLDVEKAFDRVCTNEHLDAAIDRLGENISKALVAASKPKFKTAPIKLPPDIRSKFATEIGYGDFGKDLELLLLKMNSVLSATRSPVISDTSPVQDGKKQLRSYLPKQALFGGVTPFSKSLFITFPSPKGALDSIAIAPIEKAEVIADSLQKQFEPNTDVENPRFSAHIQRFLDSPTCMDLEKTFPSEIKGFIKNLKPNKYPGIDLITNRILKNLPTKFIIFISLLFNMLLENCYFPKSWRMAAVIPILKSNSDDSNPQNYRPISQLSSLSKAYEFVILNRLNQHCLARNIIIPEQHGFVTKRPVTQSR
ncbi:RNA-directed DNA polymerase from mobile element jockey [Trichonephila clavipes]|nr:RNA-directed DNA polymerase from mobile element jockey [Trichonephila clavipes]